MFQGPCQTHKQYKDVEIEQLKIERLKELVRLQSQTITDFKKQENSRQAQTTNPEQLQPGGGSGRCGSGIMYQMEGEKNLINMSKKTRN